MSKQATVEERNEQRVLGLRAQGIADDDMARLAAFLRIGSEELNHPWALAPSGHFDVLLIGDDETVPMFDDSVFTLRLMDPRCFDDAPGQLCRPLSFEALVAQLAFAEGKLPRVLAPAAPAVPVEVAATAPPDEVMPTEVAKAVVPPEPAPDATLREAGSMPTFTRGDLYRLERLPAASTVGHDRRVLRVVSLLTLRALHFDELMTQSGLSTSDCEAALEQLKHLGVLHVIVPSPARERARSSRRERPVAQPPGVMARLRDRFGLGGR